MKTEDLEFRSLREGDYQRANELRLQYLDDDPYEKWVNKCSRYPFLTVGSFSKGDIIGLLYGRPSPRNLQNAVLDGIAVIHTLKRRGIGSSMLSLFHSQAKAHGFRGVTLGSAGGYVDHFYIKNGYGYSGFRFLVDRAYKIPTHLVDKYSIEDTQLREDGMRCLSIKVAPLGSILPEEILTDFRVERVDTFLDRPLDTD